MPVPPGVGLSTLDASVSIQSKRSAALFTLQLELKCAELASHVFDTLLAALAQLSKEVPVSEWRKLTTRCPSETFAPNLPKSERLAYSEYRKTELVPVV